MDTITVVDQSQVQNFTFNSNGLDVVITFKTPNSGAYFDWGVTFVDNMSIQQADIVLKEFPLENIDNMRDKIFSQINNVPLTIGNDKERDAPYSGVNFELPYDPETSIYPEFSTNSASPMGRMAVKTYISDRFNNWLSKEWIEGANGISAMGSVDTSSGSFTMDSLNLAKKIYDLENRIAVSGGTYYDWQEAVYGEQVRRNAEIPIYHGRIS